MEKLDLTKKYKNYFRASKKPEFLQIEPASYISIKGKGDPSGDDFAHNIQALYATAYAIKFMFKSLEKDFTVSKLEGLWWFDEKKYIGLSMSETATKIPRSEWEYRLLIRMPDFVTEKIVTEAVKAVFQKKKMDRVKEIKFLQIADATYVVRGPRNCNLLKFWSVKVPL